MAQLSRPYQIALLAVLGLAAAWFLLLHHSSNNGSTAGSSPSAPAPIRHVTKTASSPAGTVQRPTVSAHRKTSPVSQHPHARTLRSLTAPSGASARSHAPSSTATHAQSTDIDRAGSPTASSQQPKGADKRAVQVERELAQGKTVLLLFWNPKSVDDRAVQHQLQAAAHSLGSRVATHQANASEVDAFGALTQRVHVAQTPTILIINRKQQVSTLTGFNDAFVIRQAVSEARSKNH